VRGCLYNYTFHVIVTADEGGAVCVWNIKNGQREGRFLKAHGDAKVGHRPYLLLLMLCLPGPSMVNTNARVLACGLPSCN